MTSHNYQTIASFDPFFEKAAKKLHQPHKTLVLQLIANLRTIVEKKYNTQPNGYIRDIMEKAIAVIDRATNELQISK